MGFRDRFDPDSNQFVHPAGVVFVTASGRVSNYLLGVGYAPSAVRSAVEERAASSATFLSFNINTFAQKMSNYLHVA